MHGRAVAVVTQMGGFEGFRGQSPSDKRSLRWSLSPRSADPGSENTRTTACRLAAAWPKVALLSVGITGQMGWSVVRKSSHSFDTRTDAALDSSEWPAFLEALGDLFGGLVTGFHHYAAHPGRVRATFVRLDPEDQYTYRTLPQRAESLDSERAIRSTSLGVCSRPTPTFRFRIFDAPSFSDDFLRHLGAAHGVGACLFKRDAVLSQLTMVRAPARGPFEECELAVLRLLLPHVRQAVQYPRLTGRFSVRTHGARRCARTPRAGRHHRGPARARSVRESSGHEGARRTRRTHPFCRRPRSDWAVRANKVAAAHSSSPARRDRREVRAPLVR